MADKIEFFRHNIGRREIADVTRTLRGIFLTTGGEVEKFEKDFAGFLGLPHAIGVTSCTAALQLSLTGLGVGYGDEVITTPLSFAATALAVLQAGAVQVFADVEPETGNLDPTLAEKAITPRTRAILPVHLYGQLCDMKRLREIADRRGLVIVEDAAHALEAARAGVRVGELGDAACFSFYPTK
ncbi:MAG TPA: aminotransferase class V-fold PLP-dependent enzyme, partial [Candidatus Glassbacteria bacterium]|nr:aminotransferase class V-fold PLP-dependent enzyme [Candidatus Glassbacteria bacterium]